MDDPLSALARARTAPDAWADLRERILKAGSFDEAWPLLRSALSVPRSKVRPEALALLGDVCRRFGPEACLAPVVADAQWGPPPVRMAAAEAAEASAGRADSTLLLDVVQPMLGDGDERVRERASGALGVLALLPPEEAAPRLEHLALDPDLRRAQGAAAALWGLASRDPEAALRILEKVADRNVDALTRRALAQFGFAYRWRPFSPEERAALWASLERVAKNPKGPGRKAVKEIVLPLDAFNEREDALADLDAFLRKLGATRPARTVANPAPRPHAPCSACGADMDFQAYFCPACGDVKPHNPLRLLDGLPVERSPPWPKAR